MADLSVSDVLIELGCEELPAGSVVTLAQHLGNALHDALEAAGLCSSTPEIFATPRRLAVRFKAVGSQQAQSTVERRGPAKAAAYKDGEPTKALQGFLRSAGVGLDDVETIETPKGEWIVVKVTQEGKSLSEVLGQALPNAIKSMPMPRRMRWGATTHEFLRPVVWLLAIHGDSVLPLEVLGLSAGGSTYGHRFHAPDALVVSDPSSYESVLLDAYVVADPQVRRERIVQQVREQAALLQGTPVMDEALIDEVAALVEWPVALAGRFDEQFLEIPKEALIQTMQENQRYFALLDASEELLPAFITIANLESTNVQMVIDGNERVIRPRFEDTMFFWNQDKKVTLASHQSELSRLLFQEKLGSVADKVQRMATLGDWLSHELEVDAALVSEATGLCKCDLNTEIVKELAKMQGICGRYYARRDGCDASVAEAMEQHYFPKQAGGMLPEGDVSQVVSLADKVDTLVGIFGLGMKPTGAKDPFGLRRAAIGIVRIIVEKQRNIDLDALLDTALASYGERLSEPDKSIMLAFILDRLRGYLLDQSFAADAIDAVLAKSLTRPLDIVSRIQAIQEFRKTEAAVSLSAATKRIGNILKKAEHAEALPIDESLLVEPAETQLHQQVLTLQPTIQAHLQSAEYAKAMGETAQLREKVDTFFDEVMVMDKDERLKNNRLALLQQVNSLCCATAELSLLRPTENSAS